jgi:hypothetical protein
LPARHPNRYDYDSSAHSSLQIPIVPKPNANATANADLAEHLGRNAVPGRCVPFLPQSPSAGFIPSRCPRTRRALRAAGGRVAAEARAPRRPNVELQPSLFAGATLPHGAGVARPDPRAKRQTSMLHRLETGSCQLRHKTPYLLHTVAKLLSPRPNSNSTWERMNARAAFGGYDAQTVVLPANTMVSPMPAKNRSAPAMLFLPRPRDQAIVETAELDLCCFPNLHLARRDGLIATSEDKHLCLLEAQEALRLQTLAILLADCGDAASYDAMMASAKPCASRKARKPRRARAPAKAATPPEAPPGTVDKVGAGKLVPGAAALLEPADAGGGATAVGGAAKAAAAPPPASESEEEEEEAPVPAVELEREAWERRAGTVPFPRWWQSELPIGLRPPVIMRAGGALVNLVQLVDVRGMPEGAAKAGAPEQSPKRKRKRLRDKKPAERRTRRAVRRTAAEISIASLLDSSGSDDEGDAPREPAEPARAEAKVAKPTAEKEGAEDTVAENGAEEESLEKEEEEEEGEEGGEGDDGEEEEQQQQQHQQDSPPQRRTTRAQDDEKPAEQDATDDAAARKLSTTTLASDESAAEDATEEVAGDPPAARANGKRGATASSGQAGAAKKRRQDADELEYVPSEQEEEQPESEEEEEEESSEEESSSPPQRRTTRARKAPGTPETAKEWEGGSDGEEQGAPLPRRTTRHSLTQPPPTATAKAEDGVEDEDEDGEEEDEDEDEEEEDE